MHQLLFLLAASAAPLSPPSEALANTIIVTASREPIALGDAPVSATVFDRATLEALAFPLTSDILRLVPGASISTAGPAGSQSQLRIRGAEANHSLLFIDGIRFNDPAAGNEARFELLTNDSLSRIEVVRGPQSALWGSEALGGVVAVETADPFAGTRLHATAEYGSLDSYRAGGQFAVRTGDVGLSGTGTWLGSSGIDSVGDGGERDGFENRSASLKAVFRPAPDAEAGVSGLWVDGKSEFDGLVCDANFNCAHANTLDETRNRLFALRGWGKASTGGAQPLDVSLSASYLDSRNRNLLGRDPINATFGRRSTIEAQASKTLLAVGGRQHLTVAIDHEREEFRARDQQYFGATDQDRSRHLTAYVAEWRGEWGNWLAGGFALRHDDFSAFADATTMRASLLVRFAEGWTAHAAYGEGIAQPTFYDLYGFFPDSFIGNPALTPERSAGWEAGLRWSGGTTSIGIVGFTNRLKDEILDTFDPQTFISSTANADGKSRRRGIELEARHGFGGAWALAFNYTYLDANQQKFAGTLAVRELRRPKHSANLIALGRLGPVDIGASVAYVGKHRDMDFDVVPAQTVLLDDYLLGSLNRGWSISRRVTAYARMENAFGVDYEDVVGYETAGRTIYAGLRL
ncbi:MAG: TonB-dependent receptor, partial [Alphaproteobacteria bacterium]|nr:TonB-dependent receptor [Alphaproteobacteria bacterium]